MTSRNPHLAINPARRMGLDRSHIGAPGFEPSYPAIPSWWPSRVVRRAVKQGRDFRLPQTWRQFLVVNPKLRQTIRAL